MKLDIQCRNQQLNFGVGFVRELDRIAPVQTAGMEFGMGLIKALPALQTYDPAVLSDIIYSATLGNSPRVGRQEVDEFIDSMDDVKKLGKLFDDVLKEINNSVPVKVAVKNMKA
jgi:hypothetical protein